MTALTLFKDKQRPAVPEHLWKKFNEDEKNIQEKMTVPTLSPGGKKWTVSADGKKTVLQQRIDGELVPVSVLKVVIVAANPNRSRAYYEKNYDPENPAKPDCWSNDGIKPDQSVAEPKCKTCQACPMSAKNSKIMDNGKGTVACSQQKFLAVLPVAGGKIWDKPLRLKLAITSIYDGKSPDLAKEGWFAFDQYVDHLRSNGIMNTALVITKMKFDPEPDHPKILFAADDYTDGAQLEFLAALKAEKGEEIENLTTRLWTPNGVDGERTQEIARQPATTAAPAEQKAPPVDDTEAKAAAEKAEKEAAKKAAAAKKKAAAEAAAAAAKAAAEAAAKAAAEAAADDGEFVMEETDTGTVIDAKPVSKQDAPVATSNELPNDLADLVGAWAKG